MSSKDKKKLKMERLSPIPAADWSHHVSDSLNTPIRPVVAQRQKDAYTIEITSSPEFSQPSVASGLSSLQKHRRVRNIARSKVPQKTNSTPLSGLISRKPVNVAPKETPQSSRFSSPTLADPTDSSQREGLLLSISEELPQIDDFSPQKLAHSPRHSDMISASAIFPQKPQPCTWNSTPLAGIVNKKAANSSHSLNDSILVLREAEDSSDDDEIASNTSLANLPKSEAEKVSIESFESPRKTRYVLPNEHTTTASIFKTVLSHPSKNCIRDNLHNASPIAEKLSISNSVEMCGNERKNRKRALDFSSTKFMVPAKCDDVRQSPILSIMPLYPYPHHERENDCQLPIPDRLSHEREDECQSVNPYLVSPSQYGERNCQSPFLDLVSPGCDTGNESRSPILNLMSPCLDRDSKSPVLIVEPTKCLGLNLMPTRHDTENRQSPVFNFTPPSGDHNYWSPVINLDPPNANKTNSKSPVFDLTALDQEIKADRLPPILYLKRPKSAILDLMPPSNNSSKTYFKSLKSTKSPEIGPHVEKQDEEYLSDTESIVESTPRPSENREQDFGGFTASSCLQIENVSPPSTGKNGCSADELDIPKTIEVLEKSTATKCNEKCDLKFVVVTHDTSSDESTNDPDLERVALNSDDVIFPTIVGRHSPVEFNYTKRPIQSFESPSKASKPFSEAVNIGTFGSPESDASYKAQHEEEDGTDDVIEPSTTQEYFEESEQVRLTKRRKKGSLLERVKGVIAKVDASNALFDYEMKCGLRPSKGKFVSAPLVVLKKSGESASIFLVCKPLKYCGSSSHVDDLSSFILIHVNKLPSGFCDGSVVLLHFPVNVMYFSNLSIPCALAGHRIVLSPREHKIDIQTIDVSALGSIYPFSSAYYSKPMTAFRTFSSVVLRTLNDSALCQNLTEESNLYLTVLHVTKLYGVEADLKKISVLCSDEETQFCWLEFSSERDIRRATALETLHILSDGCQMQTKGFSVTARVRLDRKSKQLISYCSNNPVNNEIVFSVHPKEPNWVISSTDGPSEVKKVRSSVEDILLKKTLGCRYLLEVHGIERGSPVKLKDPQGQSIHFVVGENSYLNLYHPLPFILDGLYFFDDKLFSDEHTRVVPIS